MKLSSLVPAAGKSKYEVAIIAAREARRLNTWVRRSGETLPGKVTAVALSRVIKDEVPYYYEEHVETVTESNGDPMATAAGDLTLE